MAEKVIHADETTLKVNKDKQRKTSYMWLYATGADSPQENNDAKSIVLFDYQQGARSHTCPVDFLRGYNSYLQVDGYAAYEKTSATLAGCWAHVRRKFVDVSKIKTTSQQDANKAKQVIATIAKLYAIEKNINSKNADERGKVRQQEATPIVTQLRCWLEENLQHTRHGSLLHKAISYTLNQWPKLIRYLENGNVNIDNNRAERAIKPFVIGRKNWMFSDTHRGAQASAILYSIIETAKANGLDPGKYINYCLEKLCQPNPDIDSILPWKID